MQLMRAEQIVSQCGNEEHFTGTVWLNEMFNSIPESNGIQEPRGLKVYLVFFEPEARTAWHSHPEGQVLCVVAGNGRVKSVDSSGELEQQFDIHPGDIVSIALDEKHWHGAGPKSFMAHIAINPDTAGTQDCWMEKVMDEEYKRSFDK